MGLLEIVSKIFFYVIGGGVLFCLAVLVVNTLGAAVCLILGIKVPKTDPSPDTWGHIFEMMNVFRFWQTTLFGIIFASSIIYVGNNYGGLWGFAVFLAVMGIGYLSAHLRK